MVSIYVCSYGRKKKWRDLIRNCSDQERLLLKTHLKRTRKQVNVKPTMPLVSRAAPGDAPCAVPMQEAQITQVVTFKPSRPFELSHAFLPSRVLNVGRHDTSEDIKMEIVRLKAALKDANNAISTWKVMIPVFEKELDRHVKDMKGAVHKQKTQSFVVGERLRLERLKNKELTKELETQKEARDVSMKCMSDLSMHYKLEFNANEKLRKRLRVLEASSSLKRTRLENMVPSPDVDGSGDAEGWVVS